MQTNISARLAERLGRKLAKTTPFRSDFVVADFRVLDEDRKQAKILVQYDEKAFGAPSKEDVVASLTHLYKNQEGCPRLLPDFGSLEWYPKHQAVACNISVPSVRRPYNDVKRYGLTPIVAGTVFLGENMTDTWAVAKSEDEVFIEKVERDDIDKILRERGKAASFRTHASSLTLARVEAAYSEKRYSLGDNVKVSYNGKVQAGEILGLTTTGAQVKFQDGRQASVATANIHGLVEAAKDTATFNKQALKEYFRKAYGYDEAELDKLVQYID